MELLLGTYRPTQQTMGGRSLHNVWCDNNDFEGAIKRLTI
jgi:hypothetical protein